MKRVRLYRKTPAHLARQGSGVQFSSQGLEETSGSTTVRDKKNYIT